MQTINESGTARPGIDNRPEPGSRSLASLLSHAKAQLHQLESGRLDAELLLAHALTRPRSYLHAHPEILIDAAAAQTYAGLVQRRMKGEPVAYLTGYREFWSLMLRVTPATLIPRPETETLVEQALARIPPDANWRIADLGTGSGGIALAIASERPGCTVIATDRSPAAVQVAASNARHNGIRNVSFIAGNWYRPVRESRFDMIVCNPPYVADQDPHLSDPALAFEPAKALQSGVDGLDDLRLLIKFGAGSLRPGTWLILEHGHDQQIAVCTMLETAGFESISTYRDDHGIDRVVAARIADRSSHE